MTRIYILAFLTIFSIGGTAQENDLVLWNDEKSASASCSKDDIPICQIIIAAERVDVSQVTFVNLGKLGIVKLKEYERIVTYPVEWLKSNKEIQLVMFKTQAWRSGQRHTITEPVLVKNGKYTVR